jgi:hypothetical protein
LRAIGAEVNRSRDAALIFATDPNPQIRQKAIGILDEAARRTGRPTNAVTAFHEESGLALLAFRNPATATRAEVLEELRHLAYARTGQWNTAVPGVFTAFQLRELDAAAYFRNLLRGGKITEAEFAETLDNLAYHLSRPGSPVSAAQAMRIIEELTK